MILINSKKDSASVLDCLGVLGYITVLPRLVEYLLSFCFTNPFHMDQADYKGAISRNILYRYTFALLANTKRMKKHEFHLQETLQLLQYLRKTEMNGTNWCGILHGTSTANVADHLLCAIVFSVGVAAVVCT